AQIATALDEIASLLEMTGENVFRIRAYRRAAEAVADLGEPAELVLARDAHGIPGVGTGIADHIRELLATGTTALTQELYHQFPQSVVKLLEIPGVGPKLAARAY